MCRTTNFSPIILLIYIRYCLSRRISFAFPEKTIYYSPTRVREAVPISP